MMVAKYRSVLAVPGSPALIVSALLARLPLGMYSLAFLLLVRGTGHSYAIAGLVVGAFAFANAASAPLQGRLVDRFGRARVLAPFALSQAVVLIAFVLASNGHAGDVVLVVLGGLSGALMPPVSPTARALMQEVFPDPIVRDTAYALDSVVQEVVWITGPLLVALVVDVTSSSVAVLLLAVVCVTGTLVFVRSPLARGSGTRAAHEPRQAVLSNVDLRLLMGPVALMGVGLGAIEVGLPSLALHAGSRPASGLLLAMWSLGSMIGGLWYGARAWSSPITSRYRLLFLCAVAFSAPLIAARTIPEGVIGALLAGLTIAPVFSCQYSLVGRAVTAGAGTEAFTWVSAALVGGLAVGSAIAGALIASAGVSAQFVFSCCATAVAALLALRAREPVAAG
jgi:MFS family permease